MSIKEDYQSLNSMIKSMDDQLYTLNQISDTSITTVHGLDLKIKSELSDFHFEKLQELTEDELLGILERSSPEDDKDANRRALEETYNNDEKLRDKPFVEYVRAVLVSIKDTMLQIAKLEKDKTDLMKQMNDITDNYFNYVNTKEYKVKKQEELDTMKKQAEEETDPLKKARILRTIDYMTKAEDLSFLLEHIKEKGQKEIDNIVSVYFDHTRSALVMKKFYSRLPKFGYNETIYKYFFNIEENFLPEEYHCFNNLFLFHVMRTISFMDVDSKEDNLYASTILVRLYNLIYHKFGDQELENEFIDFIRKFDDLFKDKWTEKFTKDNETSPSHPVRRQRDEVAAERRRVMTIAEIQNHGVEPDTSLDTEALVQQLKDIVAAEEAKKNSEIDAWAAKNEEKHDDTEAAEAEDVNDAAEFDPLDKPDTAYTIPGDLVEAIDSTDTDKNTGFNPKYSGMPVSRFDENGNELPLINAINSNNKGYTAAQVNSMLDAIDSSDMFDEFDKDAAELGDELRKEMGRDNPEGKVADDSAVVVTEIGEPAQPDVQVITEIVEDKVQIDPPVDEAPKEDVPVITEIVEEPKPVSREVDAYFDRYNWYYCKADDGTYTYYDNDNNVYETGISEITILQLISTGSLTKRTIIK